MTMASILRALLVMCLILQLHGARKPQRVSGNTRRPRPNHKSTQLFLDLSSDPEVPVYLSSSSISNLSLSPWTYIDSYDESRLPSHISHARCLTSYCVGLQGAGEDLNLEAKPIYNQALVLHRIPRKGRKKNMAVRKNKKKVEKKFHFKLEMKVIPVGCTCVRPKSYLSD